MVILPLLVFGADIQSVSDYLNVQFLWIVRADVQSYLEYLVGVIYLKTNI